MNERKRCNGLLPPSATTGAPFELGYSAGSMPASATILPQDGSRIWAARLDYPDAKVSQRTWSTEVSVAEQGSSTLFLSRLTNITLGEDVSYSPSVPGIVYRILSMFSVEADGYALSEEPDDVDIGSLSAFVDLLRNPGRELPVVAISQSADGSVRLDAETIIRRIAGAAHVAVLTTEACWELSRKLGRHLSVYNGAARMYLPSRDLESDDPFRHPIHFSSREGDTTGYANWLARTILPGTFVRPRPEFEKTRFGNVRASAAELTRSQHAVVTSTNSETEALIASLQDSLAALKHQRDEDSEAAQALLDEAADTQEAIAEEKNELASENSRLRAKLRALGAASSSTPTTTIPFDTYDQFEDWADATLGQNIEILPRAVREIEKRGTPETLDSFKATLLCIRDYYVPLKIDGGLDLKRKFEDACRDLHIEETACFAQKGAIKSFPEYRARYGSDSIWLDRHFKFGAGYDPRNMFRIYFYWDDINNVVVIGHAPTHLDNMNTQ